MRPPIETPTRMSNPPSSNTPTAKSVPARLPSVRCALSPFDAASRLEQAARRGQLPGLVKADEDRFEITDFGHPFESRLFGRLTPLTDSPTPGCDVTFSIDMKRRMLWVFVLIWALTIWPGVWITHSMLRVYFPSYGSGGGFWYPTWLWYLPLTLPFAPLSIRGALRKSRASGDKEARELIAKVAAALGGSVHA